MTRLLVSVRCAKEALAALAGGADLIDVKEPRRGPLGRAAASIWREVNDAVAGRAPLSAALGELADGAGDFADSSRTTALEGYQFAKLGLAGEGRRTRWAERWSRAFALLPPCVSPVAVVYADRREAQSPAPEEIIRQGAEIGCEVVLFDTFHKDGRGLFDHLAAAELSPLLRLAQEAGMQVVLAGSLNMSTLPAALALAPDYVAVRGAVCRGGREGELDSDLVHVFAALIARRPHCPGV